MNDIERNTFRSVCQCCNRVIKGSENKYTVLFKVYPVKMKYGCSTHGHNFVLCKYCSRSVELFIKKGGMMT